jgi:hypothetical protein
MQNGMPMVLLMYPGINEKIINTNNIVSKNKFNVHADNKFQYELH